GPNTTTGALSNNAALVAAASSGPAERSNTETPGCCSRNAARAGPPSDGAFASVTGAALAPASTTTAGNANNTSLPNTVLNLVTPADGRLRPRTSTADTSPYSA